MPNQLINPMTEHASLEQKANRFYQFTVASYGGLLVLFLITHLINGFVLKTLLLQWLPLLLFVPGLIARTNHRTYSWLCFVVLIYFTGFVVEVGSPLGQWSDWVGLTLSVLLFCFAMMTSRYMQHWQYQLSQVDEPAEVATAAQDE